MITHDLISNMLGVRREAVNKAAGGFQDRHLIRYTRGILSVINRKVLENLACSCYGILTAQQAVA